MWIEPPKSIDEELWDEFGAQYLAEWEDCNCDLDEDRECQCPSFEKWLEQHLASEDCI